MYLHPRFKLIKSLDENNKKLIKAEVIKQIKMSNLLDINSSEMARREGANYESEEVEPILKNKGNYNSR